MDRDSGLFSAIISVAAGLELKSTLRKIVHSAADLADAEYAALAVLGENGTVAEFLHVGMSDADIEAIGPFPAGKGILGLLIDHPVPIRLDRLADHPASVGFPAHHPPMNSFLGVPIRVRGEVFGNLYLTEKRHGAVFTADDEQAVIALAAAAGVAIENARLFESSRQAQERAAELSVFMDRDRIARDLHDLVIQRLFAVGMSLDSVLRKESDLDQVSKERINTAVDDLDKTVKEIRQTIFDLHSVDDSESLRRRILDEVHSFEAQLPFLPHVELVGPIDSSVPYEAREHIIAVLRECLSNVVKHASAHSASIITQISEGEFKLTISDDGVGLDNPSRRSGLKNIEQRAHELGGTCIASGTRGQGTTILWRIPIN